MDRSIKRFKVVIGLSGGIDSAFSAYILKKKGFFVVAVFMRNWDDYLFGNLNKKDSFCSQEKDFKEAKKVAKFLDIEIIEVNFMEEYWNEVFLEFLSLIELGRSPNPDILCNKKIKFLHFFNFAKRKLFANLVSTGHYASIKKVNNEYFLFESEDENKDQTYFLCQISRKIFQYLIFPICNMKKSQVRKEAEKILLPNSKTKESMGICFVGENNFSDFISNYIRKENGEIIEVDSDYSLLKISNHNSVNLFTIGQRKNVIKTSNSERSLYVVGKNIKEKKLYVVEGWNNKLLYSKWCLVKEFNWLIKDPRDTLNYKNISFRSRHRQEKEMITKIDFENFPKELKIEFSYPSRALTPGQYVVLYHQKICLGGGIIWETEKNDFYSNPKFIS